MKSRKPNHFLPAILAGTLAILACNRLALTPATTPEPLPAQGAPATAPPQTADPQAGSTGLGDSLYPGFGNGGYDVQHYTLDITVNDVSTSDLTATVTIDAVAAQDLGSFNLDFIGFEITNITINEGAADFERTGQELTILPSNPISGDEPFVVSIHYTGSPDPLFSQALPFQTGWVIFEGAVSY